MTIPVPIGRRKGEDEEFSNFPNRPPAHRQWGRVSPARRTNRRHDGGPAARDARHGRGAGRGGGGRKGPKGAQGADGARGSPPPAVRRSAPAPARGILPRPAPPPSPARRTRPCPGVPLPRRRAARAAAARLPGAMRAGARRDAVERARVERAPYRHLTRNPIHEGGGVDFARYIPTPHTHISTCGNVDLRLAIWVRVRFGLVVMWGSMGLTNEQVARRKNKFARKASWWRRGCGRCC